MMEIEIKLRIPEMDLRRILLTEADYEQALEKIIELIQRDGFLLDQIAYQILNRASQKIAEE